ncbi:MAG TPA: winged helix-turn-helix transcriptional regulator [Actinomycetota bacterium]|nr:winged helix-turn-helix transcriptional regulator [Actinomycetota bacterium]
MPKRTYGQFEGLAHALDVVGERWTLLLLRDLLVGPQRYKELLEGLPGIGTNLLARRLKELQEAGIIVKRTLPAPAGSVVYDLTGRGRGLEPALIALARWGMEAMPPAGPSSTDVLRPGWGVMAFKAVFDPAAAAGVHATYQFEVEGDVFHLRVDDGVLVAGQGPATAPDLVYTCDVETLMAIGARNVSPLEAVASGRATMQGSAVAAGQVVEMFGFPPPVAGAQEREPGWGPSAMRATFNAEAARGVHETYEMHIGAEVFHMAVDDSTLVTGPGVARDPSMVLHTDLVTFMAMGAGQLDPIEALMSGRASVEGDAASAMRCQAIFGFGRRPGAPGGSPGGEA